jgi:phenylalanyl-tRNA synthetase beta subunit
VRLRFLSIDSVRVKCISSIEPVKIIYPDGRVVISPDFSSRQTQTHTSYINSCTGLNLSASQVRGLLERMSLRTVLSPSDADTLHVAIPPTRPDILHECDIMEDAAIAYGFNNLPDTFPATSTVAQPLAVSKLSDILRHEWAHAGWVEVLPLILVRLCTSSNSTATTSRIFSVPTRKTLRGSTRPTTTKRRSRSLTPKRSSSR